MSLCLVCTKKDAHHRYACPDCVRNIQRQLRELEDYAVILTVLTAPAVGANGSTRTPGYASKAPASADVLTAMDMRSGGGAAVFRLRDPRDMDDEPIRSIPGSIRGIACWLREDIGESLVRKWTITTEIAYLLGKIEHCAGDQWIGELADDIHELWQQARALAHDRPPGPLGACLTVTCDGIVWPTSVREKGERHDGGRCKGCNRTYTGLDLVRLHSAQEA